MAVSALTVTAGNGGTTAVNTTYPVNIVIHATQPGGAAAPNTFISVTLPTPGGSFVSGNAKSAIVFGDALGNATLPTIRAPGAASTWVGHVEVSGQPSIFVNFTLHATSAVVLVPTALTLVNSVGTTQVQGQAFGVQTVRVVDQFSSPMSGQTVGFAVPAAGNGTYAGGLISTTAVTNGSGEATMPTLTAGTTVGGFNVTASVAALTTPIALTVADGTIPYSITPVSGSGQFTPPNTGFLQPLVAVVRNSIGNALPGVAVTSTAPGAGASCIIGSNFITDSDGLVTASISANGVAGAYNVTLQVASIAAPAIFNLTNAASVNICTTASYPAGFGTTPYLGGQPWANPERILFDSVDGANCSINSGQSSNILRGSTFGTTVPPGSTITGFVLTYKGRSSVAGGVVTPYLSSSPGGILTGTPVAQSLTTAAVVYQRGSSTDKWGNDYSIEQVNGSGFTVGFLAHSASGAKIIEVWNVKLSVCYTTPSGVAVAASIPAALVMDF